MEKSSEVPPAYSAFPPGTDAYGQPQQEGGQYPPPPPGTQYPPPPPGTQYPPGAWGQYQGNQYPPPGQYSHPGGQQYGYSNVVVQQPMYQMTAGPPPADHMCAAIFVTLFCFWPTGIVAIMKASDSRSAMARGDMVAANSFANSARSMVRVSVIIGIISLAVVAVLLGVYFGIILKNIHDMHD